MVIKIDLNSSTWIKSQANTVRDKLIDLQSRIADTLDYDICLLLLFNDSRNIAIVKNKYVRYSKLSDLGIPEVIFINKEIHRAIKNLISIKDIVEVHENSMYPILIEGMKSEVYIPIFEAADLHGNSLRLIGSIYLGTSNHKDFPRDIFQKELIDLISDISKLYTIVLDNLRDIEKAINIISIFVEILENKEKYLPNHSFNVANWCREIGMILGYDREKLTRLTYAGLLHDIGKCLIDTQILNKPGKLTEEEYAVVKEHSTISYRISQTILHGIPLLEGIPEIIKSHHERYDGRGYPSGLKEEEVPFDSYIIGIADAVDTMLSERPYKRAMALKDVIKELYKNRGKQFHPYLVDIMAERLIKAQNQLDENLIQDMELSTLIINQKDNLTIIEGTLIHLNGYYIFKPSKKSEVQEISMADITSAEIAIKDLKNINYYYAKVEDFVNNQFYISSIKLIPSANIFSLLWNLDGVLYEPEDNSPLPIEITKVGGDFLSFFVDNSYDFVDIIMKKMLNKPIKVRIIFDDFSTDITGTIVNSYNFGPYRYFNLNYTNIPENKRDSIYRQLFKKQIELRKAVSQLK